MHEDKQPDKHDSFDYNYTSLLGQMYLREIYDTSQDNTCALPNSHAGTP